MWVNLQSIGKNVFTSKKRINTNETWKVGALWRTLRLSFASYGELIFFLPILRHSPTLFSMPSWFKPWFMPISLYLKKNSGQWWLAFPCIETCVGIMFSRMASFNGQKYFNTLYTGSTYYSSYFLSDLQLYIIRANKLPCLYAGLLAIWAWLRFHMRTEGVASIELSNLSLAPVLHEDWMS